MEYGQRSSGIFVRQNLIPQNDLQAEHAFPAGQVVLPDVHQTLAYMVGQNALSPRMLQTDVSGNLLTYGSGGYETLPQTTKYAIVPTRTDTATFNSPDITVPAYTVAVFLVRVTAVSGTTPSMTVTLQTKGTDGAYSANFGGGIFTAITTVTVAAIYSNPSLASTLLTVGPVIRFNAVISGTTPSFTWLLEMSYK